MKTLHPDHDDRKLPDDVLRPMIQSACRAYRYTGLRLTPGGPPATMIVLPTSAGVATVVCRGAATSKIAPRAQRTSFACPRCMWIPRRTGPRERLWLSWTK